jgi:hypothetical protein
MRKRVGQASQVEVTRAPGIGFFEKWAQHKSAFPASTQARLAGLAAPANSEIIGRDERKTLGG